MTQPSERLMRVLAAIEQNRRRVWAICYRMTGRRAEADDLAQDAFARAIERAEQAEEEDPTGWLLTLSTRLCLDRLRRQKLERRLTELADPVDSAEWGSPELWTPLPERSALLREDLRFAVVVALQQLTPSQRAALVLHDVCERSLEEVGHALGTNANAAKASLRRAREALAQARRREDVDVPADARVVERFAQAIESGALEELEALLAEHAWGMVDGGGIVQTSNKPTFGRRVIARQWANAKRRVGVPVLAERRVINGEHAIVVRVAAQPAFIVAIVHLETRAGEVAALRINRDPRSTRWLR